MKLRVSIAAPKGGFFRYAISVSSGEPMQAVEQTSAPHWSGSRSIGAYVGSATPMWSERSLDGSGMER
jgi:hypothetical protein